MSKNNNYAKILISGEIEVKTGLHIGGGQSFSAIGAVDSPVIRDPLTKMPIIPGSSLKGKMRFLLAKDFSLSGLLSEANKDAEEVIRLFGSSEKNNIKRARLKFNDSFMKNREEIEAKKVDITEIKYENTIDRKTSVANPRQIERVIAGSVFSFDLFYEITNKEQLEEDFENIKLGLDLLQYDYIGGHGTRGSGRILVKDLSCELKTGKCDIIDKLNSILRG